MREAVRTGRTSIACTAALIGALVGTPALAQRRKFRMSTDIPSALAQPEVRQASAP
jgi:hypothetical protein